MNHNATGHLTAHHEGQGHYTFTATIKDIDHDQVAEEGEIRAKFDVSGLTPRELAAWDRFASEAEEKGPMQCPAFVV